MLLLAGYAVAQVAVAHVTESPAATATMAGSRIVGASAFGNGAESAEGAAIVCIASALLLSTSLYAFGVARLWRAASPGRGIRVAEVALFAAGISVLAMGLLGPLDTWAEHSFAAHMLQHETLMLIAAPLLVAGRPLAVWSWALAPQARRVVRSMIVAPAWRWTWQAVTGLAGATILQLVALLLWHVPRFFDYAASHAGTHALQHISFLASALCFWWAVRVAGTGRMDGAANAGIAIACLFVTMLGTGALGALLTFAPAPWYGAYDGRALPWATSALEDQQLGGLLMWVPGSILYLVTGLRHAARLLSREPASAAFATSAAASPLDSRSRQRQDEGARCVEIAGSR
jgi:putative membrane protein